MNINTNDIQEIIKAIGSQGLGFFALYIIYHYLGQLFSAFIILKIVSSIIKTIDGWIVGWFEIKKDKKPSLVGRIVKIKDNYPHYPSLRGKYAEIKEDNSWSKYDVTIEILKNYEKDGKDGERDGDYIIAKDFLEFIS